MNFQNKLIGCLQAFSNRTAIEYGQMQMSYASLLAKSNAITRSLLTQNLEKETVVGIQLTNNPDLICAMIGVMNARCTFVFLDGALPDERLKTLLADLDLKYVITASNANRLNKIPEAEKLQFFYFDQLTEAVQEKEAEEIMYPEFDGEDSLYVYFTSGSTGKPKGIIGKNKSLLNFVEWEVAEFQIDESFRCSQFISPYFDAFLRDIFVPLFAGATICMPTAEKNFFDPEVMISWIDTQKINLIHCVPSVFRIFNDPSLSSKYFQDLKYILLSGEKIIPGELKDWYSTFGERIQLVNMYGTTEATMISSFYRIKPTDSLKARIPIGKPIANNELRILNKDGKLCNKLVPGDLYIVSAHTSKGYWKLPALTEERFVEIQEGDQTLIAYRTGDRARKLVNGAVELLGREDRQIKLRGIRIELDEIERVIFQYAFVKNAVVVLQTEEGSTGVQNQFLVAFVIATDDMPRSVYLTEELDVYLKKNLPEYMIPSNIVMVDQFPLLSNGKIDLRQLQASLEETEKNLVEPVNETEIRLLNIWHQILGDKPISVEENFNKVGGNSLSIMRLIARIYTEFEVRITLVELFNNLTIRKQASFIRSKTTDNALVISKAAEKSAYRLSAAQERIFFNYKLDASNTAYNIPMAWEIKGHPDLEKLKAVLQKLVQRHESFRTSFKSEGGKVTQVVQDAVDIELAQIDCSDKDADEAISAFVRPFDLERAPLLRAAIIQAKDNRRFFAVDVHHIVCDGMSQMILFADFAKLYNDETLVPLSIQYKDFAEWEYDLRQSENYNSYKGFWMGKFKSQVPDFNFPLSNKKVDQEKADGQFLDFSIAKNTIDPLLKSLAEKNVTNFSSLFSVFYLYLAQFSGQDDMVIGINSTGRIQQELEKVVGMFAKTLPIRYAMNMNDSFKNFAEQVHKELVQANSNQSFDLIDLISGLNNIKADRVEDLFKVMFVYQNFEKEALPETEDFASFNYGKTATKYPITMYVNEAEDAFNFRMEYLSDYFSEEDMTLFSAQFTKLVEKITEDPTAGIIDLIGGTQVAVETIEDDISFKF
ncbi:MAG: amino acid adenylation domain-containing protein [Bacteroidota bacterium]